MYKLLLGFGLGVLLGSFVGWGLAFAVLPLIVAAGLLSVKRKEYLAVALIVLGLSGGLFRIYLAPTADPNLIKYINQTITLKVQVAAEPDRRDNTILLMLRPRGSESKILATLPAYANYQYGDTLEMEGKLEWPKNFTTETEKIFDYQKYLEKDNIFFTVFQPRVKLISRGQGKQLITYLFRLKKIFIEVIEKKIPEPGSSLLVGLVVGEKQALGKEWNERFRASGLSHIVVLSGYNLSVVAENILRLAKLVFSRGLSLGVGAMAIVLFALMVGGGATVIRASIMALIALLARATGRSYEAAIALFIAGALMLLWNPKILVYDFGFQLSFLATFGVIYGPSILAPYFSKITARWGIKEILLTTISAQIIVLPWILYITGNLSLVALPANLLVLPIIPMTMLFGFLTALIGFIFGPLAWPLAFASHILLTYILLVVKLTADLPLAAVVIKQFPFILVVIFYALIFYFGWKIYERRRDD